MWNELKEHCGCEYCLGSSDSMPKVHLKLSVLIRRNKIRTQHNKSEIYYVEIDTAAKLRLVNEKYEREYEKNRKELDVATRKYYAKVAKLELLCEKMKRELKQYPLSDCNLADLTDVYKKYTGEMQFLFSEIDHS